MKEEIQIHKLLEYHFCCSDICNIFSHDFQNAGERVLAVDV